LQVVLLLSWLLVGLLLLALLSSFFPDSVTVFRVFLLDGGDVEVGLVSCADGFAFGLVD
jgi:hypothetical protein